jgi:hypothetical protein
MLRAAHDNSEKEEIQRKKKGSKMKLDKKFSAKLQKAP